MKKILFLPLLLLLSATAIHAQQVSGIVKDDAQKDMNGATVSLLRVKDSTLVKLAVTQNGKYAFAITGADSFFISISYVGFETAVTQKFYYSGQAVQMPGAVLRKSATGLKAVVVSSRKPVIENKPGKMVLNVEGTINATGTDALELLRKSPGVTVDKDDRLGLNGKEGVQVYIDGRPSPLQPQDLANYLKSLSSSQIETIEIISNPSSQYEAAGTGGIINIRLKKNKTMGFNGSVNAGASFSRNTRAEEGIALNYRNKKFNVYGAYNGVHGNTGMNFDIYRIVKDTAFDQKNRLLYKNSSHSFKAGADYTMNEKNSMGITVNGSFATPTLENYNLTNIKQEASGTTGRVLDAANINRMQNNNVNTNINYMYKGTGGKSLVLNGDYGYYSLSQDQWQPNTFLAADGKTVTGTKNYQIESPSRIDIYSVKADYELNIGKGRAGFGGKFGYVKTGNTFNQYNEAAGTAVLDTAASNYFRYTENVNAAYAKYSREFKGLSIQGGIRAEQTVVKGDLKNWEQAAAVWKQENRSFSKNYIDFFPSISLTFTPGPIHQFMLAYSRRIDRPVYKDMNPFEYRINEYSFHRGSTDIRPQYSNTISLTHTYKSRLNSTLSYSHVKDVFGQVVDTAGGMKGFLSNRNLATQDMASLNMTYGLQYKAYSLFASAAGYYSKYKASYGAGRDIALDTWSANIFVQNSFRFGKDWSAELSGFYSSPSIWQGSMKAAYIWSADAGLQRKLLQGKATIKASVSDIFNTLKWSATSDFAGQKVLAAGKQESRQAKLSFSWRFGKAPAKTPRQLPAGAVEENKRVQTSGLSN